MNICGKGRILIVAAVLSLCLAGCSLNFRTQKEVSATGAAKTRTESGQAESVLIENILLKKNNPLVEIKSDGGAPRAEIEAPGEILDSIKVSFSGSSLKIRGDSGLLFVTDTPVVIRLLNFSLTSADFRGACRVTAEETLGFPDRKLTVKLSGASSLNAPSIRASDTVLDVSGASAFAAESLETGKLKIDLTGAGTMKLSSCRVTGECDWHISGASTLEAEGEGTSLFLVLAGASHLKTDAFALRSAIVTVSCASRMECQVSESLGGSISGASTVSYRGDAATQTSVTGTSKLEKRQ